MHRSPQIFEYLLISDFGAASSPAMSSESLGMLMGMAR